MNCQRCKTDEARYSVYSSIVSFDVCTPCAMEALRLGIAVKSHPKLRNNHQLGVKESLDPLWCLN